MSAQLQHLLTTVLRRGSGPPGPLIENAYDSAAMSEWQYGMGVVGDDNYQGISGSAIVQWGQREATKLNLAPGDYTITGMTARVSFQTTTDCDRLAFAVYEKSGTTLIEIARQDLTDQLSNNASTHNATYVLSVDVTIESAKTYFYGLAMRGAATRASGRPGWRHRASGWAGDERANWLGTSGVADLPTTLTGVTFTSDGRQGASVITFRTRNRIVFSGAVSSTLIPRRTDGETSIKIDTFVGDATPTVVTLVDGDAAGTANRLVLNVDHTGETISFAGTSQTLTGQLGDTFDFLTQVNGTAANLLYLNRTDGQGGEGVLDIATISHKAKDAGTRGGSYTMGAETFRFATVTGGGTISNVEIGYEPIVIYGDSMASYSGRLGQYLPTAFTYDRMHWRAQISGNRLTLTSAGNHTAGYLRYKHTTVGLGDLCEIRDAVFCVGMYGLNDISRIGTGDSAAVTLDYFTRLEEILDDLLANENQPLVIGLAPYHDAVNATEQEAQAIIAWTDRYSSLAVEKQVAWITPWWDLVDQETSYDAIPQIRSAYTSDSGVHINATAVQAIVPLIAISYESRVVGGPWNLSARRFKHLPTWILTNGVWDNLGGWRNDQIWNNGT